MVYSLPTGELLLKFRFGRNRELGIDGVSETDGIAVSSRALPDFPSGIQLVQDGNNVVLIRNQNFKLVDWLEIETLLERAR